MGKIWTMGEILVEIMRPGPGMPLSECAEFKGPFPSGAPAIFADAAAKLGHPSGIIGGVGDDDFGKCLLDRMKSDGVDCGCVESVAGQSTAVAFVTYFEDGSRKFIFHISNTPAVRAKAPDRGEIYGPGYFHVMGCSLMADEGFRSEITETALRFVDKGARISFDPNIRKELLQGRSVREIAGPVLDNCSVLLPGVEELRMLSGEQDIGRAVEKLFKNETLEIVAVKKGSKGCSVFSRRERIDLGVYDIVPLDPTGAGDCFDAGFLCGLLEARPLADCARLASAAAALNTAAFGPMEGDINPGTVRKIMDGGMKSA